MKQGDRFGRLIVESINGTNIHCLCDCGQRKTVGYYNLMHGRTRSCGCIRKEQTQKMGKARRMYSADDNKALRNWRYIVHRAMTEGTPIDADFYDFDRYLAYLEEIGYTNESAQIVMRIESRKGFVKGNLIIREVLK